MFLVQGRHSDGWEWTDFLVFSSLNKQEAIDFADSYDFRGDENMKLELIECKGTEFTPIMEWPYLSHLENMFFHGPDVRYTHVLLWIYRHFQIDLHKMSAELYIAPGNEFFLRINLEKRPEIYITATGETISLLQSMGTITGILKERFDIDPCLIDAGEYELNCNCLNCREYVNASIIQSD